MSKVMKVMAVILLAVMVIASLTSSVNALSFNDAQNTSTVTDAAQDTSGAADSINRILGSILTIVQVVGCGIAVIMLIVLAIKYISAAPGDKAEIKKHAVVYVVGAVILFAATGILGLIQSFSNNIHN